MAIANANAGVASRLQRYLVYRGGALKTESYSYDYDSTWVGVEVSNSEVTDQVIAYEHRVHFYVDADKILKDPNTVLNKITIKGETRDAAVSGTGGIWEIEMHAPSEGGDVFFFPDDEEEAYNACRSGNHVTISSGGEFEVQFDKSTDIRRIIENGLAFVMVEGADDISSDIDISYYVYITSVEVDYTNVYEAPAINTGSWVTNFALAINQPTTLNWNYSQSSGVAQKYVDVSVAVSTDGTYTEIISKLQRTEQSITVMPEQYPQIRTLSGNTAEMRFRVRVYSQNDVASEWLEGWAGSYVFPTTWDLAPGGGENRLGDEIIPLTWLSGYRADGIGDLTAPDPTEFDIQYSTNAGESWIPIRTQFTAPSEDGRYYCDVAPNTFPSGIINWRVRAYANGYTLDLWSQESFIVRVQASTSSVSCDGKPHPTVSWASSSQIAYQVRFAGYDSGAVYGSAASHKIPYVYADGAYPVQVRTQAADGAWSDWTELEYVTIRNNAPAGSLTLTAAKTRHAVALEWSGTEFGTYILYRNGIPVYIGSGTSYTDVGANGNASYYVRGMVEPNYLQSNTAELNTSPANDCMYDLNTQKWIPLKYSYSPRSRGNSETVNVVYKYYAGRKYPVAYVDGTADRQLNVSYVFKTMEDADRVREALGHTVIFKDTRGRRIIGIFGSMTETVEARRVQHTITVVQVDYKEEVRYEA